jgi:hypothetical protein
MKLANKKNELAERPKNLRNPGLRKNNSFVKTQLVVAILNDKILTVPSHQFKKRPPVFYFNPTRLCTR